MSTNPKQYLILAKFFKMHIKYLALLIVLLVSCKKDIVTSDELLAYIPNDAALIIKINDLNLLKSDLKNNNFLKDFQKTTHYQKFKKHLVLLDDVTTNDKAILCLVEIGKGKFEFLFKTATTPNLLSLSKVKNKTIEEVRYENTSYDKISLDNNIVFSWNKGSYSFVSSSPLVLENLIRTEEAPEIAEGLAQLYKASSTTKSAVVFMNTKYSQGILNNYLSEERGLKISDFSDWISLDSNIEQNELKFIGISTSKSAQSFVSLFENVKPLNNNTPRFAPVNAEALLSFTFEDFNDFQKNQQKYADKLPKVDSVFKTVHEVGIAYLGNEPLVFLHHYAPENIANFLLNASTKVVNYQGNDIVALTDASLLDSFKVLIPNFESNYYTILENTFVFSEDIAPLQSCISSFKNDATFDKSPSYTSLKSSIVNESNALLVATPEGLDRFKKGSFKSVIFEELDKLNLSKQSLAAQLVADQNFYHTNITLKKLAAETAVNLTSPLFTVGLDADLAIAAQFVKNHRTGTLEIVIQDQNNLLYLIGSDGKVLWKKQLEGKILGKIEQVDLYKNGRLQLAFVTDTKFMILDRNGAIVLPFNKSFEGEPIRSLAVFDYDTTKNYRFLITQKEKLTMLDSKAEVVKGFTFKQANTTILQAPKHFRMGKKDYIVFPEANGSLHILDRVGKDRITVQKKIDFSNNEIYMYKNTFATTDQKGVLHQVDERGNSVSTTLDLHKDHSLQVARNTLVTMDANKLDINGKKMELPLGVYSKPSIFYFNTKLYVSVTDLQNQKIYLFDSTAKILENFPVYGTSAIDLADMDNDKKLEFVAKDLENSLIVYKIN